MPEIKQKYSQLFSSYTYEQKEQLYEALAEFFSENKRRLLDQNIQNRTKIKSSFHGMSPSQPEDYFS